MTDPRDPAATLFDPRPCRLGEGPLWHPGRDQLFWFDILGKRLLSRQDGAALDWSFEEHVSAAGWVDDDTLLIASETGLSLFDIATGGQQHLAALEADNPLTRSNDGRADPWGGFWIGTMGKAAEPGAGAIYRYFRGEIRRVFDAITIPNAICFPPDGGWLYFSDTPRRTIWRQRLRDEDGWPEADPPEVFIDLTGEGLNPDGAVVDRDGRLWNAQWGVARIACYGLDGRFERAIPFAASQISCPAFGGPGLQTLFATSARDGLNPATAADGQTFAAALDLAGQREHRVEL